MPVVNRLFFVKTQAFQFLNSTLTVFKTVSFKIFYYPSSYRYFGVKTCYRRTSAVTTKFVLLSK